MTWCLCLSFIIFTFRKPVFPLILHFLQSSHLQTINLHFSVFTLVILPILCFCTLKNPNIHSFKKTGTPCDVSVHNHQVFFTHLYQRGGHDLMTVYNQVSSSSSILLLNFLSPYIHTIHPPKVIKYNIIYAEKR